MAFSKKTRLPSNIVSALRARNQFGRILEQVERERRSFVVEKRGRPKAVILSIAEYVRLAAPEPEILRVIGEDSKRHRTDRLTLRQINAEIRAARREKRARHAAAEAGS